MVDEGESDILENYNIIPISFSSRCLDPDFEQRVKKREEKRKVDALVKGGIPLVTYWVWSILLIMLLITNLENPKFFYLSAFYLSIVLPFAIIFFILIYKEVKTPLISYPRLKRSDIKKM
jgi:hypothetical protein